MSIYILYVNMNPVLCKAWTVDMDFCFLNTQYTREACCGTVDLYIFVINWNKLFRFYFVLHTVHLVFAMKSFFFLFFCIQTKISGKWISTPIQLLGDFMWKWILVADKRKKISLPFLVMECLIFMQAIIYLFVCVLWRMAK